ncbi:cytochrome P450 [Dendryphion nanum]|uniref:Cytochrome P450 n=1 Tax=Dendryphion nanum TaxID=256645 RepID=A0A9P9IEK5_9PLEO|nr:cytochrome P450 [Dendryphion nanum]
MLADFSDGRSPAWMMVWLGGSLLVLYPLWNFIYNLIFHPLSRYPGPFLWRASRLPHLRSTWKGRLPNDVRDIHRKYGKIVRIAPNELSYADPAAHATIYSHHGGTLPFPKPASWFAPQKGRPVSISNAVRRDDHARMRRKMEPAFTERAVAKQEVIVQGYSNLFVEKLREKCEVGQGGTAIVDIVKYLTFTTVDVIGDLAFGESFHCLESDVIDDWVGLVFGYIKAAMLLANLRQYPWVAAGLLSMIPKSDREKQQYLWDVIEKRVKKRLGLETDRPDFIELWQKDDKGRNGLTRAELDANTFIMVVAGSETSATTLSAALNFLMRNPEKLAILVDEVRERFKSQEEITFASLKELKYLDAVVKETFRVASALPNGPPRISPPEGAMLCGEYIPGNTYLSTHDHTINFDPAFWHEADSFMPERWLADVPSNPESPFYNDNRGACLPFSVGPRSCIGKLLALSSVRLLLTKLLWAFDIEKANTPAGELLWESQKVFMLVEKKPFEVKLTNRV